MSSSRDHRPNGPSQHPSGLNSHPPDRHPSALVRMVEATGRTKGSSATPRPASVLSPAPRREFQTQAQLNTINNSLNNIRPHRNNPIDSQGYMTPTPQPGSYINQRLTNHGRNESFASQQFSPKPASGYGFNNHNNNTAMSQFNRRESRDFSQSFPQTPAQNQRSNREMASQQMTTSQLSAQFQATLAELQQKVAQSTNIPKPMQTVLHQQLLKMGQEFNESQRRFERDLERMRIERNSIQGQLDEARRQLNSVMKDRARISSERDSLQLKVDTLGLKSKKSIERIEDVENHWKRKNEELIRKIRAQEEQLRGERGTWADGNPDSTSRRSAVTAIHDPFGSPSRSQTSGLGSGTAINSPSAASPSRLQLSPTKPSPSFGGQNGPSEPWGVPGPIPVVNFPFPSGPSGYLHPSSRSGPGISTSNQSGPSTRWSGRRRLPHLPTNRPMSPNDIRNEYDLDKSNRTYNTEPGEGMALVPFRKDEDLSLEFKAAISKVYQLVQDWAKKHANQPNVEKDQEIANSNKNLWDYMMNCTYPGNRQDSCSHVMSLIEDPNTRYWFVMRMAITYCIKDIMSVDAFKAFGSPVAEAIEDVKKKLQERGLANDARQVLIDRQSRAVQSLVESPRFGDFRNEQLNFHTKRLRDMLGPLLSSGCARALAGKELGTIAVTAWDLAIKMYTSHLTFQIYFPETTAKFSAATMVARNSEVESLKLQIQQVRLKLVVTPVITMRDDRGTTIRAKNLHLANVLM